LLIPHLELMTALGLLRNDLGCYIGRDRRKAPAVPPHVTTRVHQRIEVCLSGVGISLPKGQVANHGAVVAVAANGIAGKVSAATNKELMEALFVSDGVTY
jgi:hypothetical protein